MSAPDTTPSAARTRIWELSDPPQADVDGLAAALEVPPVIAGLLAQRGVTDAEQARAFLHPTLEHLNDPFTLTDLPEAVDRLQTALNRGERIAVHGDYDVDGVTSTVMLRRLLEMLGADVIHFIPDRLKDGYGLEPSGIDRLAAEKAAVVVSVDCGIRSHAAATRARELGIDLIITDHHEPETDLPSALAIINPKRPDCVYPEKMLAGVGVAFKLVQALCERTGHSSWIPGFIKLAALGTIADVVPLRGENRVIAKVGLERLSQGPHATGLRALLEATGLLGETLTSFHVAFRLAPRINAAGRMSSPDLAAQLLLLTGEQHANEARGLAEQLEEENFRRQQEEADILAAARKKIDGDPDVGAHAILVVWGEGWHRGVIGIVASKLVDLYHRPAVVLTVDGNEAHGSGRSISGFDLLASLEHCGELFARFGGHRHAAGMTIDTARLKELRRRLTAYANERLGPDDLTPRLRVDGALPLSAITPEVVAGLRAMEPFGSGNRRPIFHTGSVSLASNPKVMKSRHLSMSVRQEGRVLRAVAWRMAERADFVSTHARNLDVAFNLTENHFRGETTIELSVADVRQAR